MVTTLNLGLGLRRPSAPRQGLFLRAGNCQARASIRSLHLLDPPRSHFLAMPPVRSKHFVPTPIRWEG